MSPILAIWAILKRSFKLFIRTYRDVLPFVLLYVICIYLINRTLAPKTFLNIGLDLFSTLFFFSCILYAIDLRHHHLNFSYLNICKRAIKRFFPTLVAIALMLLPAIFIGLISKFAINWALSSAADSNMIKTFLILLLFIGMITWMVIILYFNLSMYIIVVKEANPIQGLKKSYMLIRGHWFRTFMLILSLILMSFFLQSLCLMISNHIIELVRLIITPFSAALMITYYDHLKGSGSQQSEIS
ncbi:MAG: hypothetical protein JSS07_04170 [Proteobacteria bacterium]|nr:hypothetical protein [Pseudomonadota bacterium]